MLCIAGGLFATSLAHSMAAVYLAYGVGIGVGIALVYTPSIACVQPWFTRRRGLAAGIASAGIGAGTLVVPLLAASAIAWLQWRDALRVLALGVLVLGLGAALLLRARRPPSAGGGRGARRQPARGPAQQQLLVAVPVGGGRRADDVHSLRPCIGRGARPGHRRGAAVGLVGLIGIGSLVGRFAIGALADRIGRSLTLALMQLSMGAVLPAVARGRRLIRRWRCLRSGSA